VPGQLAGPERRLAQPGDHSAALGQRQVSQVTRRPPAAARRAAASQDKRHRPGRPIRAGRLLCRLGSRHQTPFGIK
jgi:hypothetical protein